ncbi:MAG TPA: DUF3224 domain-containing protein [Candidatus Limnocylindrales bacterium]|nr:DUF3224 domain-containing protein [Candidatus Limnocylindrales bacterium]
MPTISGTFELLSGGEEVYREASGGPRLSHAKGAQRFGGGIEGNGAVDWLICYRPDKTARFVGLQRIDGLIGDRSGSFVLEATSAHDGKASTGTWEIIAGTGTGELAGITGRGGFEAPGGPKVQYHLDYELDR